jgi:DNA-binding NarL/FixJ family response regulator
MRDLGLTAAERAVTRCLLHGWGNRRIAAELHVGHNTIKCQLGRAMEKCGQSTRHEMALFILLSPWALGQVMETKDCLLDTTPCVGC